MTMMPEVLDGLLELIPEAERGTRRGPMTERASRSRGRAWRRASRPAFLPGLLSVGVAAVIAFAALTAVRHAGNTSPTGAQPPRGGGVLRGAGQLAAPNSRVVPGSAKLVAEVPDPQGGRPWAVREIRTTRGQSCVTAGRVQDGAIGSIGEDGAWGDDGRFHVLPEAGSSIGMQFYCGDLDADGNAFINVAENAVIDNAAGDAVTDGSARGAAARVELCPASTRTGRPVRGLPRPCPPAALRDLVYGLLGPMATSITYLGPNGHTVSEATTGTDGAYLVVLPHRPACSRPSARSMSNCGSVGGSVGPLLGAGTIVAVHYRDGSTCRLPRPSPAGHIGDAQCPLVGYRAPSTPKVSAAQLASPIRVTLPGGDNFCASNAPHRSGCKQIALRISFTAKVAISNLNSYYEAVIDMPPHDYTPGGRTGCPGTGGTLGPTQSTIRAGQRFQWHYLAGYLPKDCYGLTLHVIVAYVANSRLGLNGIGSKPFPSPGRGATVVGRGQVTVPASR